MTINTEVLDKSRTLFMLVDDSHWVEVQAAPPSYKVLSEMKGEFVILSHPIPKPFEYLAKASLIVLTLDAKSRRAVILSKEDVLRDRIPKSKIRLMSQLNNIKEDTYHDNANDFTLCSTPGYDGSDREIRRIGKFTEEDLREGIVGQDSGSPCEDLVLAPGVLYDTLRGAVDPEETSW